MKITYSILAVIAAGCLGQTALADNTDNNWAPAPPSLAITQDGHGGLHFMYYQDYSNAGGATSVALYTSSGGVANVMQERQSPLPDNGNTRFVAGTNQHGQANQAYIPQSSHFGPASQ